MVANGTVLSDGPESSHQLHQKTSSCQTAHRSKWRYYTMYRLRADVGSQHGDAHYHISCIERTEHESDSHRSSTHQICFFLQIDK